VSKTAKKKQKNLVVKYFLLTFAADKPILLTHKTKNYCLSKQNLLHKKTDIYEEF